MKYIRTKNNRIIDTTKYYIENSNLFKNGAYQEYKKELENAIKQADTIEELCDEFVVYDFKNLGKDMGHYIFNLESAVRMFEVQQLYPKKYRDKCSICGAIWVQLPNGAWRLEPVAKMNSDGEFELI